MPDRSTLLERFAKLEAQRNDLLEKLGGHSADVLAKAPAAGAWSIAQVIQHLAIADEGMLAYLRKKREVGGHGPTGADAPFRLALLNIALVLPLKYKAPRVVATVPECSYADACARWNTVREHMRETFSTMPEELIGHGLFKHPTFGKFNVVQGLRFIGTHVQHHRRQVDRNLRTLGS